MMPSSHLYSLTQNRPIKPGFFSYRIFHYGAIGGFAEYRGVDPATYPRENDPLTLGVISSLAEPRLV